MSFNTRKNSTYLIVAVAVIFTGILLVQFITGPDDQYIIELAKSRNKKDEFFLTSQETPLPDSLKIGFKGLYYFKPKREFIIDGEFLEREEYQLVEVPQAGGKPEFYELAGEIRFEYENQTYFLTCYRQTDASRKTLFIPFRDATSGQETYGGGRYLDCKLLNGRVDLDFNKAYNPYCVFNIDYVCPIPPEENTLPFAVTAGEKMFEKYEVK